MIIYIFFLLGSFVSTKCLAQDVAWIEGCVYEDGNQNGIQDKGEKGISGIAISNGDTVLLADKQGHFRIRLSKGNSIFPILPNNWTLLSNQIVNSGFYYWNSHGDTETQQINFGLNKKKVNKPTCIQRRRIEILFLFSTCLSKSRIMASTSTRISLSSPESHNFPNRSKYSRCCMLASHQARNSCSSLLERVPRSFPASIRHSIKLSSRILDLFYHKYTRRFKTGDNVLKYFQRKVLHLKKRPPRGIPSHGKKNK